MHEGQAARDVEFLRRALALAERGWGQTAPNPMVGAVVVREGDVVGEGFHARFGGPHAERMALDAAGAKATGATVYVTLEPCASQGKQPPCADALIAAGVARVVACSADPTPLKGGGAAKLRAAGIPVDLGLLDADARELNAPFFFAASGADRPFVSVKLAVSADGCIAPPSREPQWMTGLPARAEVHRMRANADAIGIGVGTARSDDPLLTVRHWSRPRVNPVRVVFDSEARLPLTAQLVLTSRAQPVLVLGQRPDPQGAAALVAAGVDVVQVASLADALKVLHRRGVRHILVEGGALLASALVRESLADRVVIFHTPARLGPGAVPAFTAGVGDPLSAPERWTEVVRRPIGDDTLAIWAPRR